MKNYTTYILGLLFCCLLFAISCNNEIENTEPSFSENVVAYESENKFKMASDAHILKAAQARIDQMNPHAHTSSQNIKITTAGIAKEGINYYLFADAIQDDKTIAVAMQLVQKIQPNNKLSPYQDNGDQNESMTVVYTLGDVHTCTGNPCSSCSFTTENGAITGCACAAPHGGRCNHTVSSGGGKEPY